jgi:type II secretory pathway component PulF
MLFSSSRCPLPALVDWCRSLRYSLSAGLSPVRIFKQQAKSGPRALRDVAAVLTEKLEAGESLADAFEPYRDRFPPLFLELVAVGEQTGRLEDTFEELEQYYESSLSVQRNFRAQMMYPAIQFVAAILVISGLIWVLGMLGSSGKAVTTDPTGLGFTGTSGAIMFMVLAFGFVGVILFVMKVAANNVKWRARMEGMLLRFPGWGRALLSFALQRFAVALRMCVEAGLSAEKTMRYSFRATSNAAFTAGEERAAEVVKRGRTMHEALRASGAPFTDDFREMVMMGEETGNMPEVMERVANRYREEAERKMRSAAQLTSWCIYGLVAIMIIIFIFKIAGSYMGAIGASR